MARTVLALIFTALLSVCAVPDSRSSQSDFVGEKRADSLQTRVDALERANRQRVADSLQRERTTPRVLSLIVNGDSVKVPAPSGRVGGFRAFGFTLNEAGNCRLSGRLEVMGGGNKDVIVSVLESDEFTNWRNSPQAQAGAIFAEGPQTVTTFDVPLTRGGTYYLVASNRFSTVTGKVVSGEATVTCIGSPVPIAMRQ